MAINFAAANMAGYNNPEIEIVTLIMDSTGSGFINPPTYETISEILKRGVVPFLAVTDASRTSCYVLSLSVYSGDLITFSAITQSEPSESETDANFLCVKFKPNADSPIITQILFSRK